MGIARHIGILLCGAAALCAQAAAQQDVRFEQGESDLKIFVGDQQFARYVFKDEQIQRPYFTEVRAPNGVQVTRNHPPQEGDSTDHADMHPGIWMAYGDINGVDFWRNRGRVVHIEFVSKVITDSNRGSFTAYNQYRAGDRIVCNEICRYTLLVLPSGYLLSIRVSFSSGAGPIVFGDQEEMGLGVRVATPLTVPNGGRIRNEAGQQNEAGVWGRQSLWADYSGIIDGTRVGITLMPHPNNFRQSWFHARDYGLLVANPYGRNAFTKGEVSRVDVKKGESFVFETGVFIYASDTEDSSPSGRAYADYLELASRPEIR